MGGEVGEVLLDGLLVPDVREDLREDADRRARCGRDVQPRLRHQREQADHLEGDGLAAGVRPGEDHRLDATPGFGADRPRAVGRSSGGNLWFSARPIASNSRCRLPNGTMDSGSMKTVAPLLDWSWTIPGNCPLASWRTGMTNRSDRIMISGSRTLRPLWGSP